MSLKVWALSRCHSGFLTPSSVCDRQGEIRYSRYLSLSASPHISVCWVGLLGQSQPTRRWQCVSAVLVAKRSYWRPETSGSCSRGELPHGCRLQTASITSDRRSLDYGGGPRLLSNRRHVASFCFLMLRPFVLFYFVVSDYSPLKYCWERQDAITSKIMTL